MRILKYLEIFIRVGRREETLEGGGGHQHHAGSDRRAQSTSNKTLLVKLQKPSPNRNQLNQIMDMKLSIEGLEKERDFYFGKLRDIEVSREDRGERWSTNV